MNKGYRAILLDALINTRSGFACMMTKEYDYYIDTDLSKYAGKWIGIFEKNIITVKNSFKEVAEFVDERFAHKKVLISHVPEKKLHLY